MGQLNRAGTGNVGQMTPELANQKAQADQRGRGATQRLDTIKELKVRFDPNLIKGKSEKTGVKAPAALRVCNLLFDKYPDEAAIC